MSKLKNELIEKDGKYYLKCNVVVLPCEEKSNLILLKNIGKIVHNRNNDVEVFQNEEFVKIYVISNEVVNEPCWTYNESGIDISNKLVRVDSDTDIYNANLYNWRKIIATTDDFDGFYIYPSPSPSFIDVFISSYDTKPITSVLVEYIQYENGLYDPKVSLTKNTISTKKLKNYCGYDEVFELFEKYVDEGKPVLYPWLKEKLC